MPLTRTHLLVASAALDAGLRHMREAGRIQWNADDYDAAVREFNRLLPEPDTGRHKITP